MPSWEAVAGMPVAVKVTGLPLIPLPLAVAVSVFGPAVVPRVQPPRVATPSRPELTGEPIAWPLPGAGTKSTWKPGTGLPYWSVTLTAGAIATAAPTVAAWLSPATLVTSAAGPATTLAVKVPKTSLVPSAETARTSRIWDEPARVPRVQ